MRTKTGPAHKLTDPMLANATEIVKAAILDHCAGGDLWMCSAVAAQKIVGGIAQAAALRHTGCTPGPWRRMPPVLREAIASVTGSDFGTELNR